MRVLIPFAAISLFGLAACAGPPDQQASVPHPYGSMTGSRIAQDLTMQDPNLMVLTPNMLDQSPDGQLGGALIHSAAWPYLQFYSR